MKRFILTMLCALTLTISLSACGSADQKNTEQKESSAAFEESKTEQSEEEQELYLNSTFGEIYKSDELYIETDMTVESNSSPTESSQYHIVIAADKKNEKAMLDMKIDDHSEIHIIIQDGKTYKLNDTDKTYTIHNFEDTIESFVNMYTKELYIGVTEPLELVSQGEENIELPSYDSPVSAEYEKYRMTGSQDISGIGDEAYITYYYNHNSPCMEVMETSGGKTTFIFQTASKNITKEGFFDIPSDYEKQ